MNDFHPFRWAWRISGVKLTVFGATGQIGREIVRQALAAGHEVTAVVRDPARLPVTGDGLRVHPVARLEEPEALREAVTGRDAVLSGLGPRTRRDAGITTPLTRSVLAALELTGVRRLLVVSAAPVGPTPEGEGFIWAKVGLPIVRAVFKPHYIDLARMERMLADSATEWTVVRPPRLVNRPGRGVYRSVVGGNVRGGTHIGRADVAHAMLAMVDDPGTVRQAVGVAY